ncbi:transmembrane 6 superfamily member 2 isoform X2 [Tursiops truncatus]|uniref:transmembrane 6 superfamily member 2 isoform X2 n=1 Tax=Tursiops truncatus TaxID=9739 RepID=UPI003CCFC4F2
MDIPPLAGKVAVLSLGALPLSYALNHVSALSYPLGVMWMSALILGLLFLAIYSLSRSDIYYDPLYAVFAVFSFTSVVDLLIALEEDGYMGSFMAFYTKEGEPYLRTAHGVFICYWDGTVHYLLYLAMAGAIRKRKRYRNLALYWLGSFVMSILVFLPGNILGKYNSEIRPSFFLTIPYLLVPCWAGLRVFNQTQAPSCCTPNMVEEEQRKGLLRRPVDLALIIYLIFAAFFTLFRGLCKKATALPSDHPGKFIESDLSVPSQSPIPCSLLPSSNICGFSARGENQSWGRPEPGVRASPGRLGKASSGRDI